MKKASNQAELDAALSESEGKVTIVDFWAEWCGPCKALNPVLDEISKEHADKIEIVKVNVDQASDLAQKYGIRGIPTMIFFKDGTAMGTMVGAQNKADILKKAQS